MFSCQTSFNNELPECFLNFSRGKSRKTAGFFRPSSWKTREEKSQTIYHEISICPDYIGKNIKDVFSTLVHEMVHLWQYEYGKPSPNGYHNKEWGRKLVNVGLFPSDTGKQGGKMNGTSMSHYILKEGVFEKAYQNMPTALKLPFIAEIEARFLSLKDALRELDNNEENFVAAAKETRSKLKYSCPSCGINAWGKPRLYLECGDCKLRLEASV